MNQILEWTPAVSAGLSFVALILLYAQVRIATIAMKKDHLRRERHATLEYLEKNFPEINERYWKIKEKYGVERVWSNETVLAIEADPEYKKHVNEMLDKIEVLSLGVYKGIFSFDIIYDFAELQLTRMYEQVWPLVLYWEDKYRRKNLFEHFQFLMRKIRERQKPSKHIEKI